MSGLIKASAVRTDVRGFVPRARTREDAPVHVSPLAAELEQARAENAVLRDALEAAGADASKAEAAAREAGWSEGYAAAEREDFARESELRDALASARSAWDERLAEIDTLAAMMTRAALAKMFAEHDDLAHLVGRAVSHRLDTLRRESIVAIRVSGADFPDETTLTALADHAGIGATACRTDPGLRRGECRFDLQIGHVDVGVTDQARVLDGLLAGLSGAPA